MKKLSILVSSNGWEYGGKITLTYKNSYETFMTDPSYPLQDSEGNPAPDGLILDGEYVITFDEAFEIIEAR